MNMRKMLSESALRSRIGIPSTDRLPISLRQRITNSPPPVRAGRDCPVDGVTAQEPEIFKRRGRF
jgi:hypothetical protein